MDGCKVTIEEGTGAGEYYIPCNLSEYLGDDGVNHGSSTIYAYKNIGNGTDYPYIRFNTNTYPLYYTSYNNYQYIHPTLEFNMLSQVYRSEPFQPLILIVLLMFLVARKVCGK